MSEHHHTPKKHAPHALHEEHTTGPHDPKIINPKLSSNIAYWAKEFGVTGDALHEAIRSMAFMSRRFAPLFIGEARDIGLRV